MEDDDAPPPPAPVSAAIEPSESWLPWLELGRQKWLETEDLFRLLNLLQSSPEMIQNRVPRRPTCTSGMRARAARRVGGVGGGSGPTPPGLTFTGERTEKSRVGQRVFSTFTLRLPRN